MTQVLPRPHSRIRFADSGEADRPGVVFTHGAGVDRTMFDAPAAAARRAGFRTVSWDLRGHGESTLDEGARFRAADALDDLTALVDHLQLATPALVGHSLGGNISQALVRRDPERFRRLIVLSSTWSTGPLSIAERTGLRVAAPLLAMIPTTRLPRLMADASAVTPEGIAYAARCFERMPKRRFLDVWRETSSLIHPDPGYRTPVPLALIRGAEDRTGNIATAMPRWAAAEGIAEQVIPDAGHILTLDAPEASSAAIVRALASAPPPADTNHPPADTNHPPAAGDGDGEDR